MKRAAWGQSSHGRRSLLETRARNQLRVRFVRRLRVDKHDQSSLYHLATWKLRLAHSDFSRPTSKGYADSHCWFGIHSLHTYIYWSSPIRGFSFQPQCNKKKDKMKNDLRSCDRNFDNCVKKPEKKISGLQRGLIPWSRDTGPTLYQLSYEATDVGSRSILGSYVPVGVLIFFSFLIVWHLQIN